MEVSLVIYCKGIVDDLNRPVKKTRLKDQKLTGHIADEIIIDRLELVNPTYLNRPTGS